MGIVSEISTKLIISAIEKWLGKITQKFTVNVEDKGESFTITINVFESMQNFTKGVTKTLAGLMKK